MDRNYDDEDVQLLGDVQNLAWNEHVLQHDMGNGQ